MILAFNEEETIEKVLKQWDIDKLVLISKNPWHGEVMGRDKTREIAEKYAEVVELDWKSETDQRNWGLARLYDYDYVLIVDADELYTQEDICAIISVLEDGAEDPLGNKTRYLAYRAGEVKTYWKTTDYILDPKDTHKPVIAVDPKRVLFKEFRIPDIGEQRIIDVTMHHLSYCKSDSKILEKINTFEHFNQIRKDWYNEVWLKWTPEMEDIRPYGKEKSKAIREPIPEM